MRREGERERGGGRGRKRERERGRGREEGRENEIKECTREIIGYVGHCNISRLCDSTKTTNNNSVLYTGDVWVVAKFQNCKYTVLL